jgi:hypothetical protein
MAGQRRAGGGYRNRRAQDTDEQAADIETAMRDDAANSDRSATQLSDEFQQRHAQMLGAAASIDQHLEQMASWKQHLTQQMELLREDGLKLLEGQKRLIEQERRLEGESAAMETDRAALATQRATLAEEQRSATEALEGKAREIEARRSELEGQRARIELEMRSLDEREKGLVERELQVRQDQTAVAGRAEELVKERQTLDERAADLPRMSAEIEAARARLEAEKGAAANALAQGEAALQARHETVGRRESELAEALLILGRESQRLQEQRTKMESAVGPADDLQARCATLTEQKTRLEAELAQLEASKRAAEERARALEVQLLEAAAQRTKSDDQVRRAEAKAARREARSAQLEAENAAAAAQRAAAETSSKAPPEQATSTFQTAGAAPIPDQPAAAVRGERLAAIEQPEQVVEKQQPEARRSRARSIKTLATTLILMVLVVCSTFAGVYCFVSPVYRSEAVVQLEPPANLTSAEVPAWLIRRASDVKDDAKVLQEAWTRMRTQGYSAYDSKEDWLAALRNEMEVTLTTKSKTVRLRMVGDRPEHIAMAVNAIASAYVDNAGRPQARNSPPGLAGTAAIVTRATPSAADMITDHRKQVAVSLSLIVLLTGWLVALLFRRTVLKDLRAIDKMDDFYDEDLGAERP